MLKRIWGKFSWPTMLAEDNRKVEPGRMFVLDDVETFENVTFFNCHFVFYSTSTTRFINCLFMNCTATPASNGTTFNVVFERCHKRPTIEVKAIHITHADSSRS